MINFTSIVNGFNLKSSKDKSDWIKKTIEKEGKKVGEIQYVFCDDDYLLKINREFLKHDYYTDIITFPLADSKNIISGEIYISLERIEENAKLNNVLFEDELARVMIHGILHMIGYDDHTKEEKNEMREKEDYYLNLLKE